MADIKNIKISKPNAGLIWNLEKLLKEAKSGEMISLVWVSGWNNNDVTHGWVIDDNSYRRILLGELAMMQHNFTVNIELTDDSSLLAKALDD